MSRLPQEGWKTARRALGLGLLGMCLAATSSASAGCVSVIPGGGPTELQVTGTGSGDLDPVFARAIGLAPAAAPPVDESSTGDPLAALARFPATQDVPQQTLTFEVAPPNPFVISTAGKPHEPVKSIPNLPALWSGMTGLVSLGVLAGVRRVRRAVR